MDNLVSEINKIEKKVSMTDKIYHKSLILI